jgi:hypothetical protein
MDEHLLFAFNQFRSMIPLYLERHLFQILGLGLATLGYLNAKTTYLKSIIPHVILTKVDNSLNKESITLTNTGKWHAVNIELTQFIQYVNAENGIEEFSLRFEDPLTLAPDEIKVLQPSAFNSKGEKSKIAGYLFFIHFPSSYSKDKRGKSRKGKFIIQYEDVEGTKYFSEATIQDGNVTKIRSRRDDFQMIRFLKLKIRYWFFKSFFFLYIRRKSIKP